MPGQKDDKVSFSEFNALKQDFKESVYKFNALKQKVDALINSVPLMVEYIESSVSALTQPLLSEVVTLDSEAAKLKEKLPVKGDRQAMLNTKREIHTKYLKKKSALEQLIQYYEDASKLQGHLESIAPKLPSDRKDSSSEKKQGHRFAEEELNTCHEQIEQFSQEVKDAERRVTEETLKRKRGLFRS